MIPAILRYKYVPFDEGSLSIIKDGTMKFTHPKDFNDPFDCHPEIDFSKCHSKEFWRSIGNELGYSPAKRLQEMPKHIKKLERKRSNFIGKINSNIGVCCLSKNPLNLLMWAHYASLHTGFVIEFSIPIKSTTFDDLHCLVPFPVEYKKDKPIVNDYKSILREYALTKGIDWEYEQEERVLDFDRKSGIHPYDRKQIFKSVIAGMRMSDDDFAILKKTVHTVNKEIGINATVHKAEPIKGKFALFVPNRDDLNIHSNS